MGPYGEDPEVALSRVDPVVQGAYPFPETAWHQTTNHQLCSGFLGIAAVEIPLTEQPAPRELAVPHQGPMGSQA